MVIQIQNFTKRYGDFVAVDNLSFEVAQGEIFGLLGPNGAGKTTTIRVVMDILAPDEGSVTILGQPPGQAKGRVGYLPEERGLYRNLKVLDTLVYLAELKGVPRTAARERATGLLERMQLDEWAGRKVKDLSQGMQQRLQLIASLVHDPQVLFLDEPFQGLDPVNAERIKDFIAQLQREGKTIVLSTHQMNRVEALCDRIVLIDEGRTVLYGAVDEIKRSFAGNAVAIEGQGDFSHIPGVLETRRHNSTWHLALQVGTDPQAVFRTLAARENVKIERFELAEPSLDDIFVNVVQNGAAKLEARHA